MWAKVDGPLKMFRTAAQNTRLFGYAGPSTAKSTEVFNCSETMPRTFNV
jgi:hypothetical protein